MRNTVLNLTGIFIVVLLSLFLVPKAHSDAPNVDFVITPEEIDIYEGAVANLVLIIENNLDRAITELSIVYTTDTDLEIVYSEQILDELAAGDSYYLLAQLEAPEEGKLSGQIQFVLGYKFIDKVDSTQPTYLDGYKTATVSVARLLPFDANSSINFDLKLPENRLSEFRPLEAYLTVENNSDDCITLLNLVFEAPDFIEVEYKEEAIEVAPHGSATIPLTLKVTNQAQPGAHSLSVQGEFEGWVEDRKWNSTQTSSLDVNVGILGEAEIISVMGGFAVGTLSTLLIPGFLLLISLRYASRLVFSKTSERIDLKQLPEFFAASIAISLLVAFLYPAITKAFGQQRFLLQGYGLIDIAYVWIGAIVPAVLLVVVGTIVKRLASIIERIRDMKYVQTDDNPLQVLTKLSGFPDAKKLTFPQMDINGLTYFLVMPTRTDRTVFWAVPQIEFKETDDSKSAIKQADDLYEAIDNKNFDVVLDILANANKLEIMYRGRSKPRRIETDLSGLQEDYLLVRVL